MVFCNKKTYSLLSTEDFVTILILVDGFLQYTKSDIFKAGLLGHNPYFSRWFSAMSLKKGHITICILSQSLF